MFIPDLSQPGTWLVGLDDDLSRNVWMLLHLAQSGIADAALGLEWHLAAVRDHRRPPDWEDHPVEPAHDLLRRIAMAELATDADLTWEQRRELEDSFELALRIERKRERWRAGHIPRDYDTRAIALHARTFIFALDSVAKALQVLVTMPDLPDEIASVKRDWDIAFPHLKGVRDTAHHHEDRARGLDRRGQPIDGSIHLDGMYGGEYSATMNDGSLGQVEVSVASLKTATALVQRVIDAFEWHGSPLHWPLD